MKSSNLINLEFRIKSPVTIEYFCERNDYSVFKKFVDLEKFDKVEYPKKLIEEDERRERGWRGKNPLSPTSHTSQAIRIIKIHLQVYRNKINKLRIKKIMMINRKFNRKQIKIALFKKSQNRWIVKKVL